YLDEQAEKHASPQQPLDVSARRRADLFQASAASPDYDRSMRRPLDEYQAMYSSWVLSVFPKFSHHRDHVRKLLSGYLQDFLAHKLGDENALGLIGDLVFWVKRLALGKILEDLLDQQRNAVTGQRG